MTWHQGSGGDYKNAEPSIYMVVGTSQQIDPETVALGLATAGVGPWATGQRFVGLVDPSLQVDFPRVATETVAVRTARTILERVTLGGSDSVALLANVVPANGGEGWEIDDDAPMNALAGRVIRTHGGRVADVEIFDQAALHAAYHADDLQG